MYKPFCSKNSVPTWTRRKYAFKKFALRVNYHERDGRYIKLVKLDFSLVMRNVEPPCTDYAEVFHVA